MKPYLVNDKLRHAIEVLFDDVSMASAPLGAEISQSNQYLPDLDISIPIPERIVFLKKQLETFVLQMSDESAEYGCVETTETLRMQAIGLFLALRELKRHFPEIINS